MSFQENLKVLQENSPREHLVSPTRERYMRNRVVSALYVESIMPLRRWRETISSRGGEGARPYLIISKWSARNATTAKVGSLFHNFVIHLYLLGVRELKIVPSFFLAVARLPLTGQNVVKYKTFIIFASLTIKNKRDYEKENY